MKLGIVGFGLFYVSLYKSMKVYKTAQYQHSLNQQTLCNSIYFYITHCQIGGRIGGKIILCNWWQKTRYNIYYNQKGSDVFQSLLYYTFRDETVTKNYEDKIHEIQKEADLC